MAVNSTKHQFNFNNQYDKVHFDHVDTTDYYRKGNPYKIFRIPGRSNVVIDFKLLKREAEALEKMRVMML